MPFSPDDLALLGTTEEVRVETTRPDGTTHRTTIWIMTDGDDVFVRSVRGERGRWYRDLVANPDLVVRAGKRAIAARAVPAADDDSVARCSAALEQKYKGIPGLEPMLRPDTFATTLRLEPA